MLVFALIPLNSSFFLSGSLWGRLSVGSSAVDPLPPPPPSLSGSIELWVKWFFPRPSAFPLLSLSPFRLPASVLLRAAIVHPSVRPSPLFVFGLVALPPPPPPRECVIIAGITTGSVGRASGRALNGGASGQWPTLREIHNNCTTCKWANGSGRNSDSYCIYSSIVTCCRWRGFSLFRICRRSLPLAIVLRPLCARVSGRI